MKRRRPEPGPGPLRPALFTMAMVLSCAVLGALFVAVADSTPDEYEDLGGLGYFVLAFAALLGGDITLGRAGGEPGLLGGPTAFGAQARYTWLWVFSRIPVLAVFPVGFRFVS